MGNSTFDNKLRDKLQNFEPDYEEKAWMNFSTQLPNNKTRYFFQRSKKVLLYSLATAAAAALLVLGYQNQRLANENKTLVAKTSKEKSENKVPSKGESQAPNTMRDEKTDEIVSPNIAKTEKAAPIPQVQNDARLVPVTQSPKTATFVQKPVEKQVVTKGGSVNPVLPNTNGTQENLVQTLPIPPKNIPQKEEEKLIFVEPKKEVVENVTNLPKQKDRVGENKEIQKTNVPASLPTIQLLESQVIALETKTSFPKLNVQNPEISPVLPSLSARHWVTVGTTFTTNRLFAANGVALNIAPLPRWSMNVGVDFARFENRLFKNEKDFRDQNQQDFKAQIPGQLSPETKFLDIRRRRTQWDLPISLQYEQPIYKGLSLIANVGTRIFLNSRERFSYKFTEENKPEEEGDFEKSFRHASPKNRYPIFAGIGVQANVGRFQFQALPHLLVNAPSSSPSPSPPPPPNNKEKLLPIALQLKVSYRL
ncbi:MAG: hypothetical protein ACKVTZ_03985 [Bacteroidia bacterium]